MTAQAFDPLRLDMAAFASAAASLSGAWPLSDLERLQRDVLPSPPGSPVDTVHWSARGEQRIQPGRVAQPRLRLHARVPVQLCCQRCLQPMAVVLEVHPTLLFVPGEDEAARLDDESEEDVLVLSKTLDLRELVEDELILALPLVPRHDACPQPLRAPVDDAARAEVEPAAHPFAVLAPLRRRPGGGGSGQ
jgi:uncharacterized protein